jgi:hypothetical protein
MRLALYAAPAAFSLLALSACDQLSSLTSPPPPEAASAPAIEEPAPVVEPPPEPQIERFEWKSVEPSAVTVGEPTILNLSEGYAFALFSETSVSVGQIVQVQFEVTGQTERVVTAILQRHCDQENGEDAEFHSFVLSDSPKVEAFEHEFSAAYSCIRLSFLSSDKLPLTVEVSDLKLVKAGDVQ